MRALCKRCDKAPRRRRKPHAYVATLYMVHTLHEGGFRFDNEDFTLSFWVDLAVLRRRIDLQSRRVL